MVPGMQSFSPSEVGKRYGVSEMTVRNWIKRGAIGANVRKIGKQSRARITTLHVEEFEQRTGAIAMRPDRAPTREDIRLGRAPSAGGYGRDFYKRENSAAARKASRFDQNNI
jgi:hypothetical protein